MPWKQSTTSILIIQLDLHNNPWTESSSMTDLILLLSVGVPLIGRCNPTGSIPEIIYTYWGEEEEEEAEEEEEEEGGSCCTSL